MEQKITIRIAGKDFVLKASSPEEEELIRLAAIDINKRLAAYQSAFPGIRFCPQWHIGLIRSITVTGSRRILTCFPILPAWLRGTDTSYLLLFCSAKTF